MPASSRKSKGRRPGSSTDELQSQAGTAGGRSASSSPKSLRALMSSNQPPPEIQASIALAMRQKQQRQHNNKPPLSGSIWSFASGMHLCAAAYLDEAPAPSSAASTMSSTSDKDANSLSLSASLSSPRSRQSLKGNSVLGKTKSLMLSTAKRGSFSQLSRPSTSSGRVAGDNHATTTTTSKLPAVDKERATPDITRRKSTTSEKHLGSISKTPPPALRHQRSCGFESLKSSQALSIQPRSVGSMSALAVPGEPLITAIKTICIASDWDDKVLALNAELAFMHSQATQTHALSKSSAFYLLVLTSGSDASRQSLPADPSEKRISTLSFLGMHRDQIEANAPVVVRRTWKELELLDAHLHASLEVLLTRPEHTSVTRLATFLESKAKDGLVKPSNVESTRSLRKRLFSPTKRKEDHVEPFALMNTAATTLDSADSGHSSMQRVMAFKRALDDYWQRLFETCGDALATSRAVSDFFALRLGDPVKLSTPPKEMSDHHRISVFDLNAPITSEQKDSNANPENSAHSDIESAKSLRSKLSSSSSSKSLRVMLKPPASPTSLRSIATFGKPSHFDDWRTPRGSWGDGGYYKRVEGKSSSPPQDTTFRPHVSQRRPGTALPHGAQALRNVLEEDNKGVAQKPRLGVPNQLNLARQTERRATEGTLTHVPRSRVLSPSAGRLVRPRTASEAETSSRLHRKDKKGGRTSLTSTTDLADAEIRFIGVTNPYARERFGTSFHVIGREPARHVNIDGRPHTAKGLDPAASGWATFEQADSRPRASAVEQRSVSGPASAPSLKTQSDIVELLRTETRSSTSDNKSKEPSAHNTTAGLQLMSATDRIPSVEHSAHVRTHSSMSSTPSVIDALFSAAVQTLSPTVELDAEYREPIPARMRNECYDKQGSAMVIFSMRIGAL
ncbi:hypothetical protein CBOM_00864 [Ceraceosorus bombacis]|uniref:Uncharacterized protein n=1 Tax=Ceraceosorus bombacis TaxID=401625 RepID=A0A0P1BB93_9BASI|nr:hypothetical protein CBOM_00864 [Ceraceosorus bombacis]